MQESQALRTPVALNQGVVRANQQPIPRYAGSVDRAPPFIEDIAEEVLGTGAQLSVAPVG